jgi:putative PIN family toxin of toxin-antitoxin system
VRVFLDANVLVSAFASRGLCADLLEVVLLGHDLVLGRHVVREVSKALRGKLKLPAARTAEIVEFVSGEAAQIVHESEPSDASVDPDDALVLGEAIAAHAEVFVTGDAALLKLGTIDKLEIVTPRRFWEMLHTARP